jgi:hypothetical protein
LGIEPRAVDARTMSLGDAWAQPLISRPSSGAYSTSPGPDLEGTGRGAGPVAAARAPK